MLNRNPETSTAAIGRLTRQFAADADVSFSRTDLAILASKLVAVVRPRLHAEASYSCTLAASEASASAYSCHPTW